MNIEEIRIGEFYYLADMTTYRFSLSNESYNGTCILKYYEQDKNYTPIVKTIKVLKREQCKLIDGCWYNIMVSMADIIIYTNSYFLKESNPKNKISEVRKNLSDYIDERLMEQDYNYYVLGIDNCNDLDVVEIKNGVAKFNKKDEKEQIKGEFSIARREENKIYPDEVYIEPQADWNKEIIHMNIEKEIDDALKSGNREEFIRLSNKLKEMGL